MSPEQIRVRKVLSDSEMVAALHEMSRGADPREIARVYGISVAGAYRLRSAGTNRAKAVHAIHRMAAAARHAERKETES